MTRVLSIATVLGVAATGPLAAQGCDARAEGSRWVRAAAGAAPTHRYGTDGTWLATVAGIAAVAGKVFVFDEGKPAVTELSATLAPVREWGRSGPGPGEFTAGRYIPWLIGDDNYNFLGIDESMVVVFDRRDIEVFDSTGAPQYAVHFPEVWMYGLRYVRPFGPGLLALVDSVDHAGRKPRRFQAWILDGFGQSPRRTLLWEFGVPSDTGAALSHRTGREARPYWARIAGCQVAIDGATRVLFRYDESFARADSLLLPEWSVPEWGDVRGDGRGVNLGGRTVGGGGRPTALARWSDLTVDPDGWVWVRGWTLERGEFVVFAVSLRSGRTVELRPPAFPRAFGEPGVFYGTLRDPDTDEILLIRYDGTGS